VLDGAGADPAAVRRHRGPGDRPARRGPGGDRHRGDRGPGLHRPGPAPEAGRPVTAHAQDRLPLAEPLHGTVTLVRSVRHTLRRRVVLVSVVLAVILLGLFVAGMAVGDYPISLQQLFASLTGRGTRATNFIVYDLRLPRVVTGMTIGVCFGMSGAIFQSMIKNPLASPDIIGITSGASASAVVAILVLGLGGFAVSGVSLVGALLTAGLIYGLAWRKGL